MADRSKWHLLSEVNVEAKVATCSQCGPGTVIRVRLRNNKTVYACRANDRKNLTVEKAKVYRRQWESTHIRSATSQKGKWVKEREERKQKQSGICALCKKNKATQQDHCHKTGEIRGVLCRLCNLGLGHFEDDPKLLRAAAEYLEMYSYPV